MTDHLDFATELAVRAGEVMSRNFSLGMAKQWKDDNSPVTETDLAVNAMVIEAVARRFPDHGVVAEEESSTGLDQEWVWICDPVDGTIPFSHGQPMFAFALALLHRGRPVVAVVHDPMSKLLFSTESGGGTRCNGEPASVSSSNGGAPVIDVESPWPESPYDWGQVRNLLHLDGHMVQTLWSVVFGASRVITGDLAAAVCSAGHVWDVAAIALLVEQAGGRVTDLMGSPVEMIEPQQGFVVSNGDIHDLVLKRIAEAQRR